MELRQAAFNAFKSTDLESKLTLAGVLLTSSATLKIANNALIAPHTEPGAPARPQVIKPLQVDKRSPFTLDGHAALVHAICHIEFNAINLALDAIWRFPGMPDAYYRDWAKVAQEEAYHFRLLRAHLQTLQGLDGVQPYDYGSFPAHGGLWEMCEKTKDDIVARMALVPRTLEARGLDATPQIQIKLRKANTQHARDAVAILDIILNDEIGHVAIGNHWYRWLCRRDALDPLAYYRVLHARHAAPRLKPPFNQAARLQAGFTAEEIQYLQEMM
jgi:uncharacterized ferritin-like protein (DUF455 family)